MKFLVLAKNRENAPELRDPVTAMKAARDFLNQGMADGLIECVYQFSDGHRGVAITEADSAEELWETLTAYPMYDVQEYEIHPLTDVNFIFDKSLERMASAVK